MKSKQTFFFAEYNDIEEIVKSIETMFTVNYFETGLFDVNPTQRLSSLLEIDKLGKVDYGDWNLTSSYLLMNENTNLKVRNIEQRKGGIKYAVDQQENPDSLYFKPSGVLKKGVLVAGKVGTISESKFSNKLYKTVSNLIKKKFTRIGVFYVGNNALNKLDNGWRLVTIENLPTDYDLKRE